MADRNGYYKKKLSAARLRLCYEIAPPRVRRYLEAEIEFVMDKVPRLGLVLELGCGYGRVLARLLEKAETVVGIDTARDSLLLARETLNHSDSCYLLEMTAAALAFGDRSFNLVICIQNGISAFGIQPKTLIQEALRVTQAGGTVLLSCYSADFWDHRLQWFQMQADHGLIGQIEYAATGEGTIVCKDGFRATTMTRDDFVSLTTELDVVPRFAEVDGSSLFCEIAVP